MKVKNLYLVLVLLALVSCDQAKIPTEVDVEVVENIEEVTAPTKDDFIEDENCLDENATCSLPPAVTKPSMQVNVKYLNFKESEKEKMNEALAKLQIVLNSEEFKQKVISHVYKGKKQYVDNGGLSNEEVYQRIIDGAEKLQPEVDNELDLEIKLYYSNKKVIGYTYPSVNKIWVNKRYFRTNSLGKVAANIAHEWCHKLGFKHSFKRTSSRPSSVPYAIGTIVKKLVDSM